MAYREDLEKYQLSELTPMEGLLFALAERLERLAELQEKRQEAEAKAAEIAVRLAQVQMGIPDEEKKAIRRLSLEQQIYNLEQQKIKRDMQS